MTRASPGQQVGGHAVPEGAMFRTSFAVAVAVRRPSGEIVVRLRDRPRLGQRSLWLPWAESWRAWTQALDFATAQSGQEDALAAAAIGHGAPALPRSRRAIRCRLMMYRGAVRQVLAAYGAGCALEVAGVPAFWVTTQSGWMRPVAWLRQLGWRPPSDDMLEVGLVALRAVVARGGPQAVGRLPLGAPLLGRPFADACARQG